MKPGITLLLAFICVASLQAQELDKELRVFEPMVGKTWKGKLSEDGAEKEAWDVSRWERALNGKAIRILHSVNDGEYGGETMLYWNREKEELQFYYFTTAGFMTHGTIVANEDGYTAHEKVTGNQNGITEVRSRSVLQEDGSMLGTSEYLKNGEWVPGHSIHYHEDASAEVKFR
ncbi:hypothetical protein KQI65_08180 [bacterium]|nr:hypothetical protein [bacterium]